MMTHLIALVRIYLVNDMPNDKYKLSLINIMKYYVDDNVIFPPSVWDETPKETRRTNNASVAFYRHYNGQFYSSHPFICYICQIMKLQTITHIRTPLQPGADIFPKKRNLHKYMYMATVNNSC